MKVNNLQDYAHSAFFLIIFKLHDKHTTFQINSPAILPTTVLKVFSEVGLVQGDTRTYISCICPPPNATTTLKAVDKTVLLQPPLWQHQKLVRVFEEKLTLSEQSEGNIVLLFALLGFSGTIGFCNPFFLFIFSFFPLQYTIIFSILCNDIHAYTYIGWSKYTFPPQTVKI